MDTLQYVRELTAEGLLELRFIHSQQPVERRWVQANSDAAVVAAVQASFDRPCGLMASINPRRCESGQIRDLLQVSTLSLGLVVEVKGLPPPTIRIATGVGERAYSLWLLSEPTADLKRAWKLGCRMHLRGTKQEGRLGSYSPAQLVHLPGSSALRGGRWRASLVGPRYDIVELESAVRGVALPKYIYTNISKRLGAADPLDQQAP